MLDTAMLDALARRPPIWGAGAQDWWDFTRAGRAKRGVGAMPAETRASDGWVENEAGLLVKRSVNTRSMAGKGLLTFPTAANIVTAPNDFSDASWTKSNATVSVNGAVGPFGTQTMDKIEENNANSTHLCLNNAFATAVSGANYAIYGYVKAAERSVALVNVSGTGAPINSAAWFDTATGTATKGSAAVSARMVRICSDIWYCEVIITAASAAAIGFQIGPASAASTFGYQGVAGSGIFVEGWNMRQGSFGIPPIDSAATANGPQQVIDIGSRAVGGVGGIIQVDMLGTAGLTNPYLLAINDGTGNNRFVIFYNGTSIATAQTVGGVGGSSITVAAVPATGRVTVAFAASPSYQMARVVGYSAPSSIAGSYAGSALTKVVPGGNGFDAASNLYQLTKRLALWYGPMSAHFFDNVLWPKAQLLAQVA